MLPVLETPRLVLRPFGKEDAAAVFAIYSDKETNTFLPCSRRRGRAGSAMLPPRVENPASGRGMRRIGMTYRYSYEELWQPKARRVTFRLFQIDLADGVPEYDGYKRSRLRWFREEL